MKIIYTLHAKTRMRERSISEYEILETVFHPDQVITTFDDRKKHLKNLGKKQLEVVCTREGDRVIVMTALFHL